MWWPRSLGEMPEELREYRSTVEKWKGGEQDACGLLNAADSAIEALIERLEFAFEQFDKPDGETARQALRAEKAEWQLAESLRDYHATAESLESDWYRRRGAK